MANPSVNQPYTGASRACAASRFPLTLPEPTQAHRRLELPRPGLPAAGDIEGLLKAHLRLRFIRDGLPYEQVPFEAI